ncbi:MAG: hypothetical protein K2W96_26295, partial [Gemmataceae bacterium]|nr:hypothetical protein [Gemmataceae bacterium]
MAISFACPKCHLKMTVPEAMAGKRGRCSKCKAAVVVPSPITAAVPPPPPPPIPGTGPSAEEIEAAALDALSEPKKAQEEAEAVEFACPSCDEQVKLALEHAGKRHPCPHCGRIIVVPVPEKKKREDWRDTGPKKPAGARRDTGPAPEGAAGTGQAVGVSEEALREAGVIKERERPLTFYQKY